MLFRGPKGIVAGTSRDRGVLNHIPRGIDSEKMAGTSRNGVLGVPRGIPILESHFIKYLFLRSATEFCLNTQ